MNLGLGLGMGLGRGVAGGGVADSFYGLIFDGDDMAICPAFRDANLAMTKMSVFCWVKSSANATSNIVSRYFGPAFDKRSYQFLTSSSGGTVRVTNVANGATYKLYNYSSNFNDGAYHHVGFTWDAGVLTLWIDGVDATGTKSVDDVFTTIYDNSADIYLMIGADRPAGGAYYTGEMSQVLTSPLAMTQTQIQALMVGTLPDSVSCYYKFMPGTGQVLTDDSGNSHDGYRGSAQTTDANDPEWTTIYKRLTTGGPQ